MDQEDPFDDEYSFEEPKRKPPVPMPENPVISVVPIASKPFQPFSTFFISITNVTNLHSCRQSSLYLCIRINSFIAPILSPQAWCNDSEATFNCAYALDFSGIRDFSLNSFTPVIELHERYNKKSIFVGFVLCPLSISSSVTSNGKPLSFIYMNKPCSIKDPRTSNVVGTLSITIALGEKVHQSLFDPNSPTFCQVKNEEEIPKKQEQPKKATKIIIKNNKRTGNRKNAANKRKQINDYSDYYSYSEDDFNPNWEEEAIKAGWIRPGQKIDWRAKARQAGWVQPSAVGKYSTGIMCKIEEPITKVVQTVSPIFTSDVCSVGFQDNQNEDSYDLQELTKSLNSVSIKSNQKPEPTDNKPEYQFHNEKIDLDQLAKSSKSESQKGKQNQNPIIIEEEEEEEDIAINVMPKPIKTMNHFAVFEEEEEEEEDVKTVQKEKPNSNGALSEKQKKIDFEESENESFLLGESKKISKPNSSNNNDFAATNDFDKELAFLMEKNQGKISSFIDDINLDEEEEEEEEEKKKMPTKIQTVFPHKAEQLFDSDIEEEEDYDGIINEKQTNANHLIQNIDHEPQFSISEISDVSD